MKLANYHYKYNMMVEKPTKLPYIRSTVNQRGRKKMKELIITIIFTVGAALVAISAPSLAQM